MHIKDVFSTSATICYKPLGDKGEDAYMYDYNNADMHFQAVFDGCGGSGFWTYPEYKNSTGAFVAAQSCAERFMAWTRSVRPEMLADTNVLAKSFHDTAYELLTSMKKQCAPMGVGGSLVKSFPCTATMTIVSQEKAKEIDVTAVNAGDSRAYILSPEYGLVQLTRDDSRGNPDALQSLRDSAPMSNVMNADVPFTVDVRRLRMELPCAVLCASDGAFGYLRSPMDFEYIVLESIMKSNSIVSFEKNLTETIKKVTGDDSTVLISFYGWSTFSAVKSSLKKRYKYVEELIDELDAAGDDYEAVEKIICEIWNDYKKQTVYDEMI